MNFEIDLYTFHVSEMLKQKNYQKPIQLIFDTRIDVCLFDILNVAKAKNKNAHKKMTQKKQ